MKRFQVNPWYSVEEWDHVAGLVLHRDVSALQYIQVWKSRCSRLPAGVETTLSLLQATLHMDNSLTLAMAINRFLNHISHIGMNIWGVTKLHAAADKLLVPSWIVDIRHETTHGHMPSLTILRAGFELCWSWICKNYWENKGSRGVREEQSKDTVLSSLLECYMYLRVYHIWGTSHIKDIAENGDDVFVHIKSLWSSCGKLKNGSTFLALTVKQAQALVRAEILNLEVDTEQLARTLVQQDLLVPELSFLQSLVGEDEEKEDDVEVPPDLLAVWKEFIEKIDERIGAKVLIDLLVEKIGRADQEESVKEYCAAWVVEISEALLGHSKSLSLNKNHGCDLSDLERWLSRPNRLVQMMLPCFSNLVGLNKKKENLIDSLIAAAVGDEAEQVTGAKPDSKIYTVEDLGKTALLDKPLKTSEGWKSERPAGWGDQLIRTFGRQSWESLWLPPSTEWLSAEQEEEEEEEPETSDIPEFEVGRVVWPGAEPASEKEAAVIPAFYRTNITAASSPRRKKMRKN